MWFKKTIGRLPFNSMHLCSRYYCRSSFLLPAHQGIIRNRHSVSNDLYHMFVYAHCREWVAEKQLDHYIEINKMSKPKKFSLHSRFKSFSYAFSGVRLFFRTEHNAWIHALAALAAIIISFLVGVSTAEAIAIVFAIALVWITEMLNTAIEKIMDHLSPAEHPDVKIIKDVSAAAVLTAAVAAVIVALIIFIPKFL
jgi:diacylglycerol kinase (ATP)